MRTVKELEKARADFWEASEEHKKGYEKACKEGKSYIGWLFDIRQKVCIEVIEKELECAIEFENYKKGIDNE